MNTAPLKIAIKKGLNIPVPGGPEQVIRDAKHSSRVALLGSDYVGMMPDFSVSPGDYVKKGQALFIDKKMPSIQYTAPGSGTVLSISRGERRRFRSIILQLAGDDEVTFNSCSESELPSLEKKYVIALLTESGLWTSLRSRPFSQVPDPAAEPHSIFVTAMDTNPLAPAVPKIIEGNERQFTNGLMVLSRLTKGPLFLCTSPGANIPVPRLESLTVAEFHGPHPAGNAGTHIHFLAPVGRNRQAWYINAQDVIAVGILFTTGKLSAERVISLAGPSVKNPRLIKTTIGASLSDLAEGELREGENRIISGSVLSGYSADEETAYLGRYHQQVTVIAEGRTREFLEWMSPGMHLFSIKNIVLSRLFRVKKFIFNSSMHGDRRAMVPIGSYEKVMPLDIMPTHLLRSLEVDDIDEAEKLGCLELDEEDLSLCSFVCPSKIDHGAELRRNLTLMAKEW
ncbi:MAG: Na(+)-translocating NADH-quinone reductase subunit A [Nitrospira bacterium SG8_35_4]|nr:MAG: Na(+)-translocating NADH-quinone reductase subunit A [Nitrospira bacterium SG8_35_4]